ncbi:fosfomycin resistance glutathione transferase [Pseudomonas aeruginosa]|nr:fosfomycin resistance glutathione transferase [Pseudomonas aeruginosa]
MLTGLNHLTLAVKDINPSIEFYSSRLGFKLHASWNAGAYLSLGELWLCLSVDESRGDGASQDYTHYAFTTDSTSFAKVVSELRNAGVREWKRNTSEGDSFYFLDPDGHQLELHVGSLASRLEQCRLKPYKNMLFFD